MVRGVPRRSRQNAPRTPKIPPPTVKRPRLQQLERDQLMSDHCLLSICDMCAQIEELKFTSISRGKVISRDALFVKGAEMAELYEHAFSSRRERKLSVPDVNYGDSRSVDQCLARISCFSLPGRFLSDLRHKSSLAAGSPMLGLAPFPYACRSLAIKTSRWRWEPRATVSTFEVLRGHLIVCTFVHTMRRVISMGSEQSQAQSTKARRRPRRCDGRV